MASYADKSGLLTIEQVSKKEFIPKDSRSFAFGKVEGSLWFKIDVENSSSKEEFILSINESFYKKANLYHYADSSWHVEKNGLQVPLEKRGIKDNMLAFNIHIPKDSKETYCLELQGLYNYFGKLEIESEGDFYRASKFGIDSFYFFSFGLFFIVSLFNLLLFLKLKERIYFYYFAYVLSYIFYLVCISGLSLYVGVETTHYVMLATVLAVSFLILFSREYLETKSYTPRFDFLLKFLVLLIFTAGLISIYQFQPWNKIISFLNIIALNILIATAIMGFLKGNKRSILYLVISILYLLAIISFFLMIGGTLPYNYITRYGYIVAAVFEISAFSVLLADRYNKMKSQTIKAQNELIEVKSRTEERLEKMVSQKTDQLTKANSKLKSLLEERELLLKEVLHRVKNNFQIVIGLLWFKSKDSEKDEQNYLELINHIKSMSNIHELLYSEKNLSSTNSKEYIEKILHSIKRQYDSFQIKLESNIDSFEISFNDSMALGIIINEVVTNSIKHFDKKSPCEVFVSLSYDKGVCALKIQDNGSGFELNSVENHTSKLGLKLVKQFVGKLSNSSFEYKNSSGTLFKLTFTP
jgi:two-component sensor histidine kinase